MERRDRPRKIIVENAQPLHNNGIKSTYEPGVESFTTSCTGVSFGHGTNHTTNNLTRKRSLPLLSYLSSTTLSQAEKKRKRKERERLDNIARDEARKILLLNQKHTILTKDTNEANNNAAIPVNDDHDEVEAKTNNIRLFGGGDNRSQSAKEENATTITSDTTSTTIEIERASNVLMPPLLQKLLTQMDKSVPS